jgi:streptogramin lyase
MHKVLKHPVMKHPLVFVAIILLIAIFAVIPVEVFAGTTPTFTEYPLSVPTAHSAYIVPGPDGNMWFTEMENNKVGYISPSTRQITEFSLPQNGVSPDYNSPTAITKGADGNLWFTEGFTDMIGKITTSGQITEYSLPGNMSLPDSIVAGPDGNLWITAYSGNEIGVMNTSGTVIHEYPVNGGPEGISVGPDGSIWFVEQNSDQVVKMNVNTGAATNYSVSGTPIDTAAGPDGNEWFTLLSSTKLGRINPSSGAINYDTMAANDSYIASFITEGPDGNMWYSLSYTGLGMTNPSTGASVDYTTPSASTGGAWDVATGPDKNIWYTVNNNYSKIGVADIGLSTPVSGGSGGSTSGSGGSTSGSVGSGGQTGSGSGNNCPTVPSSENSASGCSANAPGHNKTENTPPATVVSTSSLKNGIVIKDMSDGTTTATLGTNLTVSQPYSVPDKQTLYVDGTLEQAVADKGATVKGTGSIGDLNVEKGAYLAPGHSPGCLNVNNLQMDGTYSAQIGGITPCSGYDQLSVKQGVELSGSLNVSLINGFNPKPGTAFEIINNQSKNPVSGTFAGLSEGSIFLANNTPFEISYKGGDGNDVVIKALQKDAYLSLLTSGSLTKHTPGTSQGTGISGFIKRNFAEILTGLIVAFTMVSGIIVYKFKTHEHSGPQLPGALNTPIATR